MASAGVTLLYIDIWDEGIWCFSDGTKPKAAAAWKEAFGGEKKSKSVVIHM